MLNIYGNIKNSKILISDLIVSEGKNNEMLLSNQNPITISKGFKHLNIENIHIKNIHDGRFICIISSEKKPVMYLLF